MPPARRPAPRLVRALDRLSSARPMERKLLVAPSFGVGRELLRRLSLSGRGWIGFAITTPRPLAATVARPALEGAGLRGMDAFDRIALIDEAIDGALRSGADPRLVRLSDGVGFRSAVHAAVDDLRAAGVGPRDVRRAGIQDADKRRFLARVLELYQVYLAERRRADTASILGLATEALDASRNDPAVFARRVGAEAVALLPGLDRRGLAGSFLEALQAGGAVVLETDPVRGLDPPDGTLWSDGPAATELAWLHAPGQVPDDTATTPLHLFAAASVDDELREVMRRALAEGRAWDEVEIVTPDPATYGSALHALATRLGIPVTYAAGLPVERTRAGRAVAAYLDWISGGFQADVVRRLIEAADLRPGRAHRTHLAGSLARRFRSLRIGWGRARYRSQIRAALAAVEAAEPNGREPEEVFRRRIERTRGELLALRSMLFPALRATPSVPDRLGEGGGPVSPAELARGLRAFLKRVRPGTGADRAAREQILARVERIEATLLRRTTFEAAVTILRGHLDLSVRAPGGAEGHPDDVGAPYRSEGGHLHLSGIEHGGFTGRPAVFVVGLDADRVPGRGGQDPVLLDRERRSVSPHLPVSTDRMHEESFRFAALLARLRGDITLSHAAWSGAEARTVGPSPVLLKALRLKRREPSVDYAALHAELEPVVSPVPRGGLPALDAADVWMGALGRDGVFRSGLDAVRASFPRLDRGLVAHDARRHGDPGPHHGVLQPRPDFDPRRSDERILSASRLENLGACPLRYLYGTVLKIYPIDEPELDPDAWLDARVRGGLLHAVYESTLRTARERGVKPPEAAFEDIALGILGQEVAKARREVPSPGEGVTAREITGLGEDVRSFVRLIREDGAPWEALEFRFGLGLRDALVIDAGGPLRVRGAIDRVDRDLQGLHVVDYKTGKVFGHSPKAGTFDGGRRLQHAIYALAAEGFFEGDVFSGAYHFPTRRGENDIIRYGRMSLAGAPDLLEIMLGGVAAGAFVPTDDPNDCRFCDFAPVCRARPDAWGPPKSPLAEWSAERMNTGSLPHAALRATRGFEK